MPPIVNKADINSKIPIAAYKSRSIESLINKAPENKSAYFIKTELYYVT